MESIAHEPVIAPPRPRIRKFLTRVLEVRVETPDTVTLVLDDFGEAPPYRAGQFLTIDPRQFPELLPLIASLEREKGKRELVRAYSMSSAPHEPLAITIKEEPYIAGQTLYAPLLSPLLVKLRPGARLQVAGFTGSYVLPDDAEEHVDQVLHVVAGSGAVPNFSILKGALEQGVALRHVFIASNKTWADVCFGQQLAVLEGDHPDRLRVIHTLTRETNEALFQSGTVHRGRISVELFARHVADPDRTIAFVCGPGITPWERKAAREIGKEPALRFLESAVAVLRTLGVPRSRVHFEAYG